MTFKKKVDQYAFDMASSDFSLVSSGSMLDFPWIREIEQNLSQASGHLKNLRDLRSLRVGVSFESEITEAEFEVEFWKAVLSGERIASAENTGVSRTLTF